MAGYMKGGGQLCHPHLNGVPLDHPPFYNPTCPKCRLKKERGLVTGNEPASHGTGYAQRGLRERLRVETNERRAAKGLPLMRRP